MERKKNIKVSEEEIGIQGSYMKQVKSLNTPDEKKFIVQTFGCQMSESDGERMAGMLAEMGYAPAEQVEEADVIVFNTCCVREHAEKKILSRLGQLKQLKEKNRELVIAFGGCMAQQPHVVDKIKKSYRNVDIIFGTHNIHVFPELLYRVITGHKLVAEVPDIEGVVVEGLPVMRKEGLKAWVNIMYGCNNFCSYCIVPYVRGRERSRDPEDILKEIRQLAEEGYKEVTLLGQNVNSYGLDVESGMTFAGLLREVNSIDGIERIRFMTSHPKDFSDDLINAAAECGKVCEHIHIPFQSGSTRILEKMNRRYTKEQYLGLIQKIRKAVPEVSFTTDIIVGFPGETEEDFLDTLDVIEKVGFDLVYTFIYSKRTGTPAAEMPGQVEDSIKKDRFDRLLNLVYKIVEENNHTMIGKIEEVLVESKSRNNPKILTGRTRTNKIVNFAGDESLIGRSIDVKIVSQHKWYLAGELL